MIDYTIKLDDRPLRKRFRDWRRKLPKLQDMFVRRLGEKIAGDIKAEKLTGQVLNIRSGRLRNSIGYRFVKAGAVDVGSVMTNVIYAAIHEFGGDIYPRNASALHFQVNGRWVTTQHVRIPARPYAWPTIEEWLSNGKGKRLGEETVRQYIAQEWR
jgi:phage gpG-like protein